MDSVETFYQKASSYKFSEPNFNTKSFLWSITSKKTKKWRRIVSQLLCVINVCLVEKKRSRFKTSYKVEQMYSMYQAWWKMKRENLLQLYILCVPKWRHANSSVDVMYYGRARTSLNKINWRRVELNIGILGIYKKRK